MWLVEFWPKQQNSMHTQDTTFDASLDQVAHVFGDSWPGFECPTGGGYPDIPVMRFNTTKIISATPAWNEAFKEEIE